MGISNQVEVIDSTKLIEEFAHIAIKYYNNTKKYDIQVSYFFCYISISRQGKVSI